MLQNYRLADMQQATLAVYQELAGRDAPADGGAGHG
jgi:hypothetical protein